MYDPLKSPFYESTNVVVEGPGIKVPNLEKESIMSSEFFQRSPNAFF